MSVIPLFVTTLSSARLSKIAWSSIESLVEVISSMEKSGLLASGIGDVRSTCPHNVSGISSRGVEGWLLDLDVVDRFAERAGRCDSADE
jgi:hypothetical protein